MAVLWLVIGACIGCIGGNLWGKQKEQGQAFTPKPMNYSVQKESLVLPTGLGMVEDVHAKTIEEKLERAIDPAYFEAVKTRLVQKGVILEEEYPLYLLELKRYFVLTTLMKHVPMYNSKVDAIWHEMILFTADYQAFCQAFAGSMIHHQPTITSSPTSAEKGLFDYVYGSIFTTHDYTSDVYPSYHLEYASSTLTRAFLNESVEELMTKYFAPIGYTQRELVRHILETTKYEVEQIKKKQRKPVRHVQGTGTYPTSNDYLFHSMHTYSMFETDDDRPTKSYGTDNSHVASSYEDTSTSSNSYSNCSSNSSCSSSSNSSSSSSSSCSSSSCSS